MPREFGESEWRSLLGHLKGKEARYARMRMRDVQQRAALARRKGKYAAKLKWFGDRVSADIRIGMNARMRLAAQLLRDKIVINLSTPVGRDVNAHGHIIVTKRSKPREFPRAETTRLMKDIFYEKRGETYIVGTSLDYGLRLETKMARSFLVRTLREEENMLRRILILGRGSGKKASGADFTKKRLYGPGY